MALLSLGPQHSVLHSTTYHPNLCSHFVPALRRACVAGWRGADTIAAGDIPSTSYPSIVASFGTAARQRVAAACTLSTCETTTTTWQPFPNSSHEGKVGVVIVDHGSRKKASNDMLIEFGDLYGKVTGHEIVEIAHMEIAQPTILEAIGRCAARGACTVVVAPYFLSRGRHIQEDIPLLVRQAQECHPQLRCVIADPIGIDVLMVQLISNRVAGALKGTAEAETAAMGK